MNQDSYLSFSSFTNSKNECVLVSLCELFGFESKEEAKEWYRGFKIENRQDVSSPHFWTKDSWLTLKRLESGSKEQPININGKLYNFYYHRVSGGSVKTVAKYFPEGKLWVSVNGHSLVVTDGQIKDTWDSSRRHVEYILEVVEVGTNQHPIFTSEEDWATYKKVLKRVNRGMSLKEAKEEIENEASFRSVEYYRSVLMCLRLNNWDKFVGGQDEVK